MVTFLLLLVFFFIYSIPSGPFHKECSSYATSKYPDFSGVFKDKHYCYKCKKYFDIKPTTVVQSNSGE